MIYGEILKVALVALRANKLRSALTMLGIVIGVAAVIAVVALGRGAQEAVNERIQALGTTLLTVIPGQVFTGGIASSSDRARLYVEDADALAAQGTTFTDVEPEISRQLQVQFQRANTSTNVIAATANYANVRKYTVGAGQMFTQQDDEGRKRVAVLGATTASNLTNGNGNSLVGQNIRISGIQFQVVGVFDTKGGATGFNDPDDQVIIPLSTGRFRVFDTRYLRSINLLARSEDSINVTMAEIERIMRRQHRIPSGQNDDFEIRSQADFLNAFSQTTQVFGLLLGGIATVSLLVGGIGIMNIMLVSVTERTREIGLRLAIGARGRDVLLQFLVEAVVLSLFGGTIGIGLGFALSKGVTLWMSWPTAVSPQAVLVAFGFAAITGVFFGFYPAQKAAALDPIDALRFE